MHVKNIFFIYSILALLPLTAMEVNNIIQTYDGLCTLSQEKIDASGVLLRRQCLKNKLGLHNTPTPINVPLHHIVLLSNSLDHMPGESFNTFFYGKLSEEEQNDLFNLSKNLEVPTLIQRLLYAHCEQEWIKKNITQPYFPEVEEFTKELRTIIIKNNVNSNSCPQEVMSSAQTMVIDHDHYNKPTYVPEFFIHLKNKYSGCHRMHPIAIDNVRWKINTINTVADRLYFTMQIDENNDSSQLHKLNVWVRMTKNAHPLLCATIEHTSPILCSTFSDDGLYCATGSENPDSSLILTQLNLQPNGSSKPITFFLPIKKLVPTNLLFDRTSKILLATSIQNSKHILKLWSIVTGKCIKKITGTNFIQKMIFNNDKTRLVSYEDNTQESRSIVTLWDASDLPNIKPIKSVTLGALILKSPLFSPNDALFVVITGYKAHLFDSITGNKISELCTEAFHTHHDAPIFIPSTNLITTTIMDTLTQHEKHISLWDITRELALPLASFKGCDIRGIGTTLNGQYIIITTDEPKIITIQLWDDKTEQSLLYLEANTHLIQKYLLYRIYKAHMHNNTLQLYLNTMEFTALASLTICPSVKQLIESHIVII